MSNISNQRKLQHLYLRAGFGESITVINSSLQESLAKSVEKIFNDSKNFTDLDMVQELPYLKKKNFFTGPRGKINELNIRWVYKMTQDPAQLREKMTLFWHGHFACRSVVAPFVQNQNNTLRKHALGKFGDLLMGISKDPAMLQFLNSKQSKKFSPNENFAREVMELFTLGRGHYSETDIKEAARAFTGWEFNAAGEYVFRERNHDTDKKIFFGKTGNFSGEDIIHILLEQKRTAEFITGKIYKYFVNENVNTEIVQGLAKKFYESEYDIEGLMRNIFSSDWFYNDENIGVKIKSPIELLVCLIRSFNINFGNPKPLLNLQRALGQTLFNPPNVSGWAGGKNWIDTSSLMYRLKLPELIFKSSALEFDYKEEPQEMGEVYQELSKLEKIQYKQMSSSADLGSYLTEFSRYDRKELMGALCEYLLQTDIDPETKLVIESYDDDSNIENLIESLTLRIISLPEYQLC